ncbi:MAG: galactose-1-epimerase, partial [Bacillota bacterium]|nr:galactose-1-epimerase [Bacillota bacterium]
MKTNIFGQTKDGKNVTEFIIENKNGMSISVLDFGAILHRINVPSASMGTADVALCCPDMEVYSINDTYLGSTIAPNANRIGNAKLTIDGTEYTMEVNDGPNNLHTAFDTGMNKMLWDAEAGENCVKLTAKVADGVYGLPGNRVLTVTYTLTDDNEIKIDYTGTSDKNTIINMTNHTYFNLK